MKSSLSNNSINIELQKAKDIINCFINSCSHNLKSPLTSIEGLVMIAEYSVNPHEINQCLGMIQHCALNMINMIHKLEEYTAIQNHELSPKDIQARVLVGRVMNEYNREINYQGITVSTTVSQSIPWISDEYCNYLILKNLVGNAIHFNDWAKESRRININVKVAPKQVFLEVSDNGIGIGEEEKAKIFEPFHRSSSQSKGNGLGLFLVKGALEKLKASMSVESTKKLGASFRISMPNIQAA